MSKITGDQCRNTAEFNHCYFNSGCCTKHQFCINFCKNKECKYKNKYVKFKINLDECSLSVLIEIWLYLEEDNLWNYVKGV